MLQSINSKMLYTSYDEVTMANERIESPDDPERCEGTNSYGQCQMKRVPGAKYCAMHRGTVFANQAERKQLSNYKLIQYQQRMEEKSNSNAVKSLRDEIGILRMALESMINSCKSENDLVLASQSISDLVVKIEKLVTACHRLDGSMGQLLDKSALMGFAAKVIDIVTALLPPDQLETVAKQIIDAAEGKAVETVKRADPLPAGTLDISDED